MFRFESQEYKISPYILCRWKDKQWLSMSASASNTRPVCNRLFVINLHQFRHLFWFIYLHEMYISKQVVECITLKLIEVEACIAIQSFLEFSIESYFKYFCFTSRENILWYICTYFTNLIKFSPWYFTLLIPRLLGLEFAKIMNELTFYRLIIMRLS